MGKTMMDRFLSSTSKMGGAFILISTVIMAFWMLVTGERIDYSFEFLKIGGLFFSIWVVPKTAAQTLEAIIPRRSK